MTCLAFHPVSASGAPPTHLLSGGADGELVIWQAGGRWEKLKALKAHRDGVSSLAVHPSGRLALSCGRDRGLRLWDLVKGRCTYKTKMAQQGESLAFSASGSAYHVLSGAEVGLFDVATGELTATLAHSARLLCAASAAWGGALVTGGEARALCAWDMRAPGATVLTVPDAHATRIRGIAVPWGSSDGQEAADGGAQLPPLVASAGSDGSVKLWDLRRTQQPVCSLNTRARLTCLLALPPGAGAGARGCGGACGAAAGVPRSRVAVETAPRAQGGAAQGVSSAHQLREAGVAWWESGEKGPKLSQQFEARQQSKRDNERAMRGVNPKELKERQAKEKTQKEELRSFGKQPKGEQGGADRAKRPARDRDAAEDQPRPQKKGGGGQYAKAGQRPREGSAGATKKPRR